MYCSLCLYFTCVGLPSFLINYNEGGGFDIDLNEVWGRSGSSLFGLVWFGGLNYIHNVDELAMLCGNALLVWELSTNIFASDLHNLHTSGLINMWKGKIKGMKQAMVHVYS